MNLLSFSRAGHVRSASLVAACLLAMSAGAAHAQIYRCEGANGVVEYSNSPSSAQSGRTCRAVDLQPITTIPAPKLPPAKPAAGAGAPAGSGGSGGLGGSGGSGGSGSAAGAAPASGGAQAPSAAPRAQPSPEGFPRVDSSTQRARDNDRRRILEEEMRKEEAKLAEIRKEYNNGEPDRLGSERNYQRYLDRVQRLKDDIARSEANIATIKKELSAIRD